MGTNHFECILTTVLMTNIFTECFVWFQMKIETIKSEKETVAESMLRTQFKMELIVYTQDGRYSKKLGKRKREDPIYPATNSNDSGASLREMMKHLKAYHQVSVIEIPLDILCLNFTTFMYQATWRR